jgi:hypothetical protein
MKLQGWFWGQVLKISFGWGQRGFLQKDRAQQKPSLKRDMKRDASGTF